MESWGQVIEDAEVEVAEVDIQIDDIQWAIKALKAHYAMWKFQQWQKESAEKIASSVLDERVSSLEIVTHDLVQVTLSLRDLTTEVEGMDGFRQALNDYRKREAEALNSRGITFGIQEIDDFTYGIHEGELAVVAAGPKTGKSVTFAYILLNEWKRGRRVTLFTLENSVKMTYDRLVCMLLGVDHDQFRRGLCQPDEVERIEIFLRERDEELKDLIRVVQPQKGQRTVQWLTRHARTTRSDSLLIDQLTFLEASHRSLRGPDKITDIMHDLKTEISTGSNPIPCMLAHQINREGMREAKKGGWLEMHMLAEGSEVERTADWVFGLYASPDERKAQMIKWQTLATRRGSSNKNWRMAWRPWVNQVEALGEIEAPA
jgi:replicative DNA helicase